MHPWMTALVASLGKQAADATKKTVRSETVKPGTPEAKAALSGDLKPAAHVAPTRYGRKPYSRGMKRDST
jgi:hypothetical protein